MRQYKDRCFIINDMRLHYLEWGNEDACPMLLLHGTGDHVHVWDHFASYASNHFRIIALDQRGHGESDWAVPPSYTCDDYVRDLAGLIEVLHLTGMVMMGHSMGALHGTGYAAMRPERVAALIHVDIEPCPPPWNKKYLSNLYKTLPTYYHSIEEFMDLIQKNSPYAKRGTLAHVAKHALKEGKEGRFHLKCDREVFEHFDAYDLRCQLSHIRCPTLIVRGEESRVMRAEAARDMKGAILNSQLSEIPRATHPAHIDNQDGFRRSVIHFLRDCSLLQILIFFLFLGLTMTAPLPDTYAQSMNELHKALPKNIRGWGVAQEDRFYDRETIFDYIDGAGEVYRAYNMEQCLSRQYTHASAPSIVLDIFLMGSSKDAFGVFTHDQDGEGLEIGQGALYRPGWLSLWKGPFFVSIYAEEETAQTKQMIKELGRTVASHIKTVNSMPDILSILPQEGLKKRSIRYLHHYIILNYHYYLSDENILTLTPETDAVLAEYERHGETARLLIVFYPEEGAAKKAYGNFMKHYLPEADTKGFLKIENGKWSAANQKGHLVAIVLDSYSRRLAETLLKSVTGSFSTLK
ncbi:MAG: alpha/beta hydrolase [Pseudomonadota bacterium]